MARRRSGTPTVRDGDRSVRRRAASGNRRRRSRRIDDPRPRCRDRHVCRLTADSRSRRHDPDRRRVRRHARPPRHDRSRERSCGGRRRPDRRHGLEWNARASGAERPPRDPAVERRGGVRRPARSSPASGRARPDVRSRHDSGPVGLARCAAGRSVGAARCFPATGGSASAAGRAARVSPGGLASAGGLACSGGVSVTRSPVDDVELHSGRGVAARCGLAARGIFGAGVHTARNGRRGRRSRRRGDRPTAAGRRGRSHGLAAGGSARPGRRSARRAARRPSRSGLPRRAEVGDGLDLAALRGADHRRSAGRVDVEPADAVAPAGRPPETPWARARTDIIYGREPRGACRRDAHHRSAEHRRGGDTTAGARPRPHRSGRRRVTRADRGRVRPRLHPRGGRNPAGRP